MSSWIRHKLVVFAASRLTMLLGLGQARAVVADTEVLGELAFPEEGVARRLGPAGADAGPPPDVAHVQVQENLHTPRGSASLSHRNTSKACTWKRETYKNRGNNRWYKNM